MKIHLNALQKSLIGTVVALSITAGATTIFAWSSAPSNPPASNVSAPINAGNLAQIKSGPLEVNGFQNDGTTYLVGNTGVGILPGSQNPTYKLEVGPRGNAAATVAASAFFYASDVNLKKNIETLPDALQKVLQLRGVSFNWKSDGTPSIGVIAQEVEKVYPELVSTDSSGSKSVQYGNLVAPLIEAIKAQQAEIDSLKAEVAALKAAK